MQGKVEIAGVNTARLKVLKNEETMALLRRTKEGDQAARQEIFDQLEKSYISGVTFSGGDPLYPGNRMEITALAKEIRERFPEKTIWMYTGSLWETVKNYEVMKYVDVLVDGEYECDKRDTQLHWKGSSNQRVINVQDSLRRGQVVLHNS